MINTYFFRMTQTNQIMFFSKVRQMKLITYPTYYKIYQISPTDACLSDMLYILTYVVSTSRYNIYCVKHFALCAN